MKDKKDLLINVLLILIVALLSTTITSCSSIKQASYWKERSLAAEAVIDTLINHYDDSYIYDVMMETDVWSDYSQLKYK